MSASEKNREPPSIDSWMPHPSNWARLLERLALVLERPINKLSRTSQLNPFYHTGTIAVFLLIIVGVSGFYLFLFFQYGFDASYQAVARIEGQLIARIMRALHRYASGAAVITTLLHAYRTLFMERFRGPRWLAWVTGIVMTAVLWGGGVTGYWLIWDGRAQLITDSFVRFLERFTPFGPAFVLSLFSAEVNDKSWIVILVIFAAHVLLYLTVAGFFWLHIRRLSRAKWLPAPQWVIGMGVVLFLGSVLFPVGMLAQANPLRQPGAVGIDPLFLYYLPFSGQPSGIWLWSGLLFLLAIITALPWLPRRKQRALPRVRVIDEKCTGCTRCALDCPYKALAMVEREDNGQHKFLAVADQDKCVSCGICIGSCDDLAITLGETPPELIWETVSDRLKRLQAIAPDVHQVKIVFTCERFAAQSARAYLDDESSPNAGRNGPLPMAVIPLPCAGAVPPDLLIDTLDAGAAEVQVVGCPPDDCAHREGNLWAEQRLTRQRAPRLKRAYANVPIAATWLPPDSFEEALQEQVDQEQSNWLESRRIFQLLTWRNFLPAFSMLAIVMALQIWLTDISFRPQNQETAVLRLVQSLPATPFGRVAVESGMVTEAESRLEVDGEIWASQVIDLTELIRSGPIPIFEEVQIEPGTYHLNLELVAENEGFRVIFFNQEATLKKGEIFPISPVPRFSFPRETKR